MLQPVVNRLGRETIDEKHLVDFAVLVLGLASDGLDVPVMPRFALLQLLGEPELSGIYTINIPVLARTGKLGNALQYN